MAGTASGSSFFRVSFTAWIISLLFHLVVLVTLGLTLHILPKGPPSSSEALLVGEVTVKTVTDSGETYYQSADETTQQSLQSQTVISELFNEAPAVRPSVELPKTDVGAAVGSNSTGTDGGLGGLTGGPQGRVGLRPPGNNSTRTSFLNQTAEGNSFVYVLDRSASMESPNMLPMNAAKAALKQSLLPLKDVNQFQIIFYNDKPYMFKEQGAWGGLLVADEKNKAEAHRFIDAVVPDGATRHKEALLKALKLSPDVIFFLTDGDQPAMNTVDLAEIQRRNSVTSIYVVQFGLTPYVKEDNWLVRLAHQNRGQFSYVNLHDWTRRR